MKKQESVELITPAQERQLTDAMLAAIRDTNKGMDPNEAIAKQASDCGLGPEFACRMVEAFNTSKTLHHLKTTSGEKRAESFDLADRDKVLNRMYNPEAKKTKAASLVSDRLSMNFNKVKEKPVSFQKAASAPVKASPLPETVLQEAHGVQDRISWARRELSMKTAQAKEAVHRAMCDFIELYRTPKQTPFEEVDARIQNRWAGGIGKKAMDILWSQRDFELMGEKRAEEIPSHRMEPVADGVYQAAEAFCKALEKHAEALVELYEFNQKAAPVESFFRQSYEKLGLIKRAQPEVAAADPTGQLSALTGNEALPPLDPGTQESVLDVIKSLPTAVIPPFVPQWLPEMVPKEKPEVEEMISPKHEKNLRSIKMQVMVNDMIANDPVLSAYPPEDVINAVNTVTELTPAISTNPLLMRGMVARILQQGGHLDPAEVDQLLKTEIERRKTGIMGY